MASKITPGKFFAKVVDYGIRSTKAGDPEPTIRFRWCDKDADWHEYNWRSSLKEGKAREFTLKALDICGFTGDDLSVLCDGKESNALSLEKQVSITVELQPGQDGKEYPVITYVNDPSEVGFKNLMEKDSAKAKISAMNLKADILRLRAQLPQRPVAAVQSEIPF